MRFFIFEIHQIFRRHFSIRLNPFHPQKYLQNRTNEYYCSRKRKIQIKQKKNFLFVLISQFQDLDDNEKKTLIFLFCPPPPPHSHSSSEEQKLALIILQRSLKKDEILLSPVPYLRSQQELCDSILK